VALTLQTGETLKCFDGVAYPENQPDFRSPNVPKLSRTRHNRAHRSSDPFRERVKVSVADVRIEHEVKLGDVTKRLDRPDGWACSFHDKIPVLGN
jgi:hypothetical protein